MAHEEEEIIAYESTSHPLIVKTGFLVDSSQMTWTGLIQGLGCYLWCQISWKCNFWDEYYFKAFKLDEWEVHSYMIIPSLSHEVQYVIVTWLYIYKSC